MILLWSFLSACIIDYYVVYNLLHISWYLIMWLINNCGHVLAIYPLKCVSALKNFFGMFTYNFFIIIEIKSWERNSFFSLSFRERSGRWCAVTCVLCLGRVCVLHLYSFSRLPIYKLVVSSVRAQLPTPP